MKLKKKRIGMPTGSGKLLGTKVIDVTRILYSYGGGMGGANGTVYATEVVNSKVIEGFKSYMTLDGVSVDINPRFIVKMTDMQLVAVESDNTRNWNYSDHTWKFHKQTDYYPIYHGQEFEVLEKYRGDKGMVEGSAICDVNAEKL